jgi:hypothetical protein
VGVVAADLDNDGRLDLACADGGSSLGVFFQTDAGGFSPDAFVQLTDSSMLEAVALAIGDLNEDGAPDLLFADRAGGRLGVFFQTGEREFTISPEGPLTAPGLIWPVDVTVVDIDADGDLDCLAAANESLFLFSQTSKGHFEADSSGALTVDEMELTRCVLSVDIDSDGDLDLLGVSSAPHGVRGIHRFLQVRPGRFSYGGFLVDEGLPYPLHAVAEDLDGDTEVDLAATSTWTGPNESTVMTFFGGR